MDHQLRLLHAARPATVSKGHFAGSLQSCTCAPLILQPVSPMTTSREGSDGGSASSCPLPEADLVPAGIVASQAGRSPSGTGQRSGIGRETPSTRNSGQSRAWLTTTRAIGLPPPA